MLFVAACTRLLGVYRYIILEITEVATNSKTSTTCNAFFFVLWYGAALPLNTKRRRVQLKIRLVRISLFTADLFFKFVLAFVRQMLLSACLFVYVLAFILSSFGLCF